MKHIMIKWLLSGVLVVGMGLTMASDEHPLNFEDVQWQKSSLEDMQLLTPYLGTFRGESFFADGSGVEFYFTVRYEWYDRNETIIKYTLTTHLPASGEARPLGEGFYYFDPFTQRIAVYGAFKDGRLGSGFVSPFDRESHAREVRVHAKGPDGTINEVRDTFWIIDENSFGNRTFISTGGKDWQMVSEGTYTRIKEPKDA